MNHQHVLEGWQGRVECQFVGCDYRPDPNSLIAALRLAEALGDLFVKDRHASLGMYIDISNDGLDGPEADAVFDAYAAWASIE